MTTRVLPCTDAALDEAAALLRAGSLVAFPTETVYGLGADGLNAAAVRGIFLTKGRPSDNPLILHIHDTRQADALCRWSAAADTLATAFWPGPLTMILPKKPAVPDAVTAGLPSVAVRCPAHPDALRLLRACACPVAAPSANTSGRPSPTAAQHVKQDMAGKIPLILDGGPCQFGVESTVLDLTGEVPTVLRPGAITPEQVAMVLGECRVAGSVMRPLKAGESAPSPGMRHRHYAPRGEMVLFDGEDARVAAAICARYDATPGARIFAFRRNLSRYGSRRAEDLGDDALSAAHRLFYLLRRMDDERVPLILSETLPQTGVGLAVMNRMARAAAFKIQKV